MRSGSIRHPEKSHMVIRRDWQVKALTEGREQGRKKKDDLSECGAELLSIFEFHHDNRHANKILKSETDKFLRKNPKKSHPLGDWMPYTVWYLRELLLNGRSRNIIVSSIILLESKGFISSKVPKDILTFFNANMTWLRFMPDAVNKWIDDNCEKSWISDWSETRPSRVSPAPMDEVVDPETEAKIVEAAELKTKASMINAVCAFHRHIHNKNKNTVYDGNRKNKVGARINERRAAGFNDEQILGQCALVVIGNVVSEWHQGKDTDKNAKVFDDVNLMFRDAMKFENHMSYAEAKGITSEMAYKEFQGFLSGQPSRYAKGGPKNDSGASMAQRDPFENVKPEQRTQYRQFARTVTSFFLTETPIKDIIEFAKTNNQVIAISKGLTDDEALMASIGIQLKVFRPKGVSTETEKRVSEFVKIFCKLQRMNQR